MDNPKYRLHEEIIFKSSEGSCTATIVACCLEEDYQPQYLVTNNNELGFMFTDDTDALSWEGYTWKFRDLKVGMRVYWVEESEITSLFEIEVKKIKKEIYG